MKRLKRRYLAGLLALAGIMVTIPAFASPPFPHKCAPSFGCAVPGTVTHQAANNFEPTYYLFGQSGYGGFGKLYIPANGDKQALGSPAAPTLAASATGGTLGPGTKTYRLTALNAFGEGLPGPAASVTTTGTTGSVNISWAAVMNATQYNVYGRSGSAGSLQKLATVSGLSYTDNGLATPSGAQPTVNATIPRLMRHAVTGEDSHVDVNCNHPSTGYAFRAHVNLTGLAINNPAGLINATAPATKMNPSDYPGTLGNPRFSIRWFPSVSRAPTSSPPGGGNPGGWPTGPPPPGSTPPGGGGFQTPNPGEIGTGNVSGTNNPPSAQDQTNFCTFRENLFVEGRATLEVKNVVIAHASNPDPGNFNLIVKDATGTTVRARTGAGNQESTNDGCKTPPEEDVAPCDPALGQRAPAGSNGDNWPRIEPSSYLGNYQVSVTAGFLTNLENYDTQISCNDNATGSGLDHVVTGTGPIAVNVPAGANVHIFCLVRNTEKPLVIP